MKKTVHFLLIFTVILSLISACTAKAGGTAYKAGTYEGKAQGHNGEIILEVTLDSKKIKKIELKEQKETEGIADLALKTIPAKIVENQSLNIDAIAGATVSSKAILQAVENALTEAGVNIENLKKVAIQNKKTGKKINKNADIGVVGGGIAGLSAVLEASDNGVKNIVLIEKMPALGGSTIRCGGKLQAAGTKIQKKAGIEDSPEQFADYLMKVGENKVDKTFIDLIANKSAENIDWLIKYGVEFSDEIEPVHSSVTPARGHKTLHDSGVDLVKPLEKEIKKRNIEILCSTPAVSLIEKNGKVTGVVAKNAEGDEIVINSKAVILATGGFTRNAEMVKQYYPSAGNFVTQAGDGNTGDGIKMGMAVGADIVMPDGGINLTLDPIATYYGYGEEATGLFVTPDGQRFMNEKDFHFRRTRVLMDKGFDNCWYIFDEKTFNDRVAKTLAAGGAVEAHTVEELAQKMGIKAETLKNTIQEYNRMAKNGKDTKFGKAAEFMIPIEGKNVYAVHMIMVNSGTHGGLKINIDGQVMNKEGKPIKGLYAAGEVASGQILYKEYPGSGTAIISFLTFGRQAGKAAALELKK